MIDKSISLSPTEHLQHALTQGEVKWKEMIILTSDGNIIFSNSLAVQWLRLHIFTAEDLDLIPGWGTMMVQTRKGGWDGYSKQRIHGFSVVES